MQYVLELQKITRTTDPTSVYAYRAILSETRLLTNTTRKPFTTRLVPSCVVNVVEHSSPRRAIGLCIKDHRNASIGIQVESGIIEFPDACSITDAAEARYL